MTYSEDELLPLSGLQHFAFCRRQWALIHIERLWAEDLRTVEGALFHQRAHDQTQRERRGGVLTLRGLSVASKTLGLSGQCDVVEFHAAPDGVPLHGEAGLWAPYPVEYKRGAPKAHQADELQLCAGAALSHRSMRKKQRFLGFPCLRFVIKCSIYTALFTNKHDVFCTCLLSRLVRGARVEIGANPDACYAVRVAPRAGCAG